MALALDDKSDTAWSYKTNLLMEKAKLAEMEGMDSAKADYLKQTKQAQLQLAKLEAEKREREEDDSSESQASVQPSPSSRVPRNPALISEGGQLHCEMSYVELSEFIPGAHPPHRHPVV